MDITDKNIQRFAKCSKPFSRSQAMSYTDKDIAIAEKLLKETDSLDLYSWTPIRLLDDDEMFQTLWTRSLINELVEACELGLNYAKLIDIDEFGDCAGLEKDKKKIQAAITRASIPIG